MDVTLHIPEWWADAFAGIHGCTDGGCQIHRPKGMHTNGGCRCSSKVQEAFGCDRMQARAIMTIISQVRDAVEKETEPND